MRLATTTLLILAAASPVRALQVSRAERDCLQRYVLLRQAPGEESLAVLRRCASEHPDSHAIQLTLGRRLMRDEPGTLEPSRLREARAALERAAELGGDRLGDGHRLLAQIHERLAMLALVEATRTSRRTELQDETLRAWRFLSARELDDPRPALAAWRHLRPKPEGRRDRLALARLQAMDGQTEAALRTWGRLLTEQRVQGPSGRPRLRPAPP